MGRLKSPRSPDLLVVAFLRDAPAVRVKRRLFPYDNATDDAKGDSAVAVSKAWPNLLRCALGVLPWFLV